MESIALQELITIRGSGTTPVVQSKDDWLDLPSYGDVVFFIELLEVTNPGGGSVTLSFETAPSAVEALFVPIESLTATVFSKVQTRKVLMNATGGIPLARFLRWKVAGTTSGTWDITFRVYVSVSEANRNAFSPLALPGLLLWLRADLGVTLSGSNVTTWRDQSGNGFHVSQGTGASQPLYTANGINTRAGLDFASGKFMESTTSLFSTGGQAYTVFFVGKNGNGSFLSLRRSTPYSASMFFLSNTYVWSDGSPNETVPNTLAITQSATPFKSCHRYSGAGNFGQFWLRGIAQTPVAGSAQTTESGTAGFQVGTNSQTVPEPWNGMIGEVIVMKGAASTADRQRVELYQQNFFGV